MRWLRVTFLVVDIAMADVLRPVNDPGGLDEHPACRDCAACATAWPAFAKAHADPSAHFANAD